MYNRIVRTITNERINHFQYNLRIIYFIIYNINTQAVNRLLRSIARSNGVSVTHNRINNMADQSMAIREKYLISLKASFHIRYARSLE